MQLTCKSVELLIDLIEIKLSTMEISDREDRRAARDLERALHELKTVRLPASGGQPTPPGGADFRLPH